MSKRVGIYVRVSTQDQSTEIQLSELTAYCGSRGWSDLTVYEDHGMTGTNTKRPEFQRMLKDARGRKLDLVIVWKLDRAARSLRDLILTLQEFTEIGVEFVSIKDNVDLTTSAGRLLVHLIGAFGEFEASLIRERVRAGIANAKAKGKRLGRPLEIDAEKVTQMRAKGMSLGQIATKLRISKAGVHKALARVSA